MRISSNLDIALRNLGLRHESRTLWVDAICINQQNLDERGKQVTRIGEVFACAKRVVVWLGLAYAGSKLAISTLQYLGEQIEISAEYGRSPALGAEEPHWWDMDPELPYSESQCDALISFFKRRWFHRLWVVQEIALANPDAIFQYGEDHILYYHLR